MVVVMGYAHNILSDFYSLQKKILREEAGELESTLTSDDVNKILEEIEKN